MKKLLIGLLVLGSISSFAQSEKISEMKNSKGDKIIVKCLDECNKIQFLLDRKVGKDLILNTVEIKKSVNEVEFKTNNQLLFVSTSLLEKSGDLFLRQGKAHGSVAYAFLENNDADFAYTPFGLFIAEIAHLGVFVGYTSASIGVGTAGLVVAPFELAANLGRDIFSLNSRTKRKLNKMLDGKSKTVGKRVFEKAIKMIEKI